MRKVLIPSPLVSYTKQRHVDAAGQTLGAVLTDLDRQYPGIRFRMVDEQDHVRPHMRIFINGAQVTDLEPGELVFSLGDTHVYHNHFEQARLQLSREPRALPRMRINPTVKSLFEFCYDDFRLEGYDPHPRIAAPIAV